MSLLLASLPVSAAVCPHLPVNLVNRRRASLHDVDEGAFRVELLVTISFLNQVATNVLPFMIVEDAVGFEVVLGSQWETWCGQNKGLYFMPFFSSLSQLLF